MPLFPTDTLGSLVTNTFFLVTRDGVDFEGIFDNQQDVFSWWETSSPGFCPGSSQLAKIQRKTYDLRRLALDSVFYTVFNVILCFFLQIVTSYSTI